MTASDISARLARRLAWHQALHDPDYDPRARSHWLAELRRWQAARLRVSFAHFLEDPTRAPAANFFLGDVYGDRDFTRRDADIPTARLKAALTGYSQQVGALRLLARGIDAQVARPLDVATQDLATAEAKRRNGMDPA